MARIVKAKDAPSDLVGVTLGQLTLEADQLPYETNDAGVIAAARNVRAVEVEEDDAQAADAAAAERDELDPHVNPTADHLSTYASPEAVAAAEANDAAIRAEASPYQNLSDATNPTVKETVESTFEAVGVSDAPEFATTEAAPAKADEPAAPAPAEEPAAPEQDPAPSSTWSTN